MKSDLRTGTCIHFLVGPRSPCAGDFLKRHRSTKLFLSMQEFKPTSYSKISAGGVAQLEELSVCHLSEESPLTYESARGGLHNREAGFRSGVCGPLAD